jgi:hypothetical protein
MNEHLPDEIELELLFLRRKQKPPTMSRTDWAHSKLAAAKRRRAELDARKKQLLDQGFPAEPQTLDKAHLPEGIFTFAQAVTLPWCKPYYRTEGWLRHFLQKTKYEHLDSGLINQASFERLMAENRSREKRHEANRKRDARHKVK